MSIATARDQDAFLEELAAKLTTAAYPIVLRNGAGDKWLDLELELWKALTDTLKKLKRTEDECVASCCADPKTSDFFG